MNIRNIDFIVTFYKYDESQINYWANISKKIEPNINVFFAVDSIWTKKQKDFLLNKNKKVFWNNRNTGKLKLIELFVRENYDNLAKFIKICDPDDSINLKELKIFEQQLKSIDNNSTSTIIINIHKSNNKIYFLKTLANYNTILSKKVFKQKIFNLPEISKSSDTILGFISTTINPNVLKIKNSFYIYNDMNGISGSKNLLSQQDLNKYFFEFKEVINFYKKYEKYNNDREYNCTPSHMTYVWARNVIIKMEKFSTKKDKRKEIVILLNEIKSVMRMNEKRKKEQKWLFWKIFYKLYLQTLIFLF